ncbi:MAG: hypothetical protein OXC66_04875 [Roseovarius sp.]|nr:hypothetical protein [Roseovarius sp.]
MDEIAEFPGVIRDFIRQRGLEIAQSRGWAFTPDPVIAPPELDDYNTPSL